MPWALIVLFVVFPLVLVTGGIWYSYYLQYQVELMQGPGVQGHLPGKLNILILILFSFTVMAAIAGWSIWNHFVKHYRGLFKSRNKKMLAESHLDHIHKYANDIIILTDSNLGIVQVNDKALTAYQYGQDELIKMNIKDLIIPEMVMDFTEKMKIVNADGKALFESIHGKKDGTTFPIEVNVRKFRFGDDEYFQWISRDITERKNAARELESSYLLLKATIDSTMDGLLVVDDSGKILVHNRKFAEMWSIPEDILAARDDERALSHVLTMLKDPGEFITKVRELYSSPEKISFDTIEFLDGRVVERYSQARRLNENVVGRVWSFRDVSEKFHAGRQLLVAKEKAEESDRLKTAFLHNISHEIRTPMNAIVGFSALLDDPELDEESRRNFTSIITDNTNRLLALISDIVEISNIEAGQVRLTYSVVNVNHLLKDLHSQFSPEAGKQNLLFDIDASLPDERAVMNTDRAKLSRILAIFIDNALKFTKKGFVKVGYRISESDLDLYVSDSGIGIEPSLHEKIFDRFYQVEAVTSREFSGAGLGLSISKAYADMLGCNIVLDSTKGKGSEFVLRHPL